MFAEGNTRVRRVVLDWLERYFPATGVVDSSEQTRHHALR
jgi:hypothetical protein